MDVTIKQLADEIGVSKPYITKRIDALGYKDRLIRQGNKFVVPAFVADAVRESFQKPSSGETAEQPNDLIAFLQSQIEMKDRQIERLQDENAELVKTIQQSNYLLMTANADDAADVQATVDDEPQPVEKKSFWQKLFG